jgi:hypothetical protein|tara:strand:+ start:933 stop:1592 length:660 start_codon:yes stop_codon:yes gene_type:complete
MKLLFLGCSWTYGDELGKEYKERRFSTLIGKNLNAEVVNHSRCGFSNHAIARIFLEQDLEEYDFIFVQMTTPSRTEWYDPTGNFNKVKILEKLKSVSNERWKKRSLGKIKPSSNWDKIMPYKKQFMCTGNLLDGKEWWQHYYEEIYTDEYGETEEMLIYNLIRNKLVVLNKKHVISSINPSCKQPIDINLRNNKYPLAKGGHPDPIGHIMISRDIMKLL